MTRTPPVRWANVLDRAPAARSRARRSLAAAIAVAMLAPAAATGPGAAGIESAPLRHYDAVTINAPGQDGHVSLPSFVARTATGDAPYGPHMHDQLAPYQALRYKDGRLDPRDAQLRAVVPGALIYRDAFGIPIVEGATFESAWYGLGYALAQDRMWQKHVLRMAAWGRLSELIGRDGLSMDRQVRRDGYTRDEYAAAYASLEPWEQAILHAYAAGTNQYILEMHVNPWRMPAEIAALALPVEPWTPLDTLALGTLVARSVASGGGAELSNAQMILSLIETEGRENAKEIFSDILWLNDPGAPTAVPAAEGTFSSYPHGDPLPDSLDRSIDFLLDLEAEAAGSIETVAAQLRAEEAVREEIRALAGLPRGGSNTWAIAPERSADGETTYLYSGPQVGYDVPALLVEFGIRGAGPERTIDAAGITVAGVPVVGIGRTPRHAWGLTSGLSDTKDLYIERLTGPRTYLFNGEEREMDCRTETLIVKSTLELIEATPPTVETLEVCRTIHGPVLAIDEEAGLAYAQRWAMWDREIDTLKALMRAPLAESLEEFRAAVHMVSWNENTSYADRDGNIAIYHPGLYPMRNRAWDERLPFPGTGEAEWEGFIPKDQMPQTENPAQGWVADWNSKPSVGWTSGDPHFGDRPWGEANRLHSLTRVLEADDAVTGIPPRDADGLVEGREGVFAPDVSGGLYDQTVEYFRPLLADAAADPAASAAAQEAIALILDWDGNHQDTTGDGRVDHAGATIFHDWVERAARSVFDPYLRIGGWFRGGHRFEPSPVINMFLRALLGGGATLPQSRDYLGGRTANEAILDTLEARLGVLAGQFSGLPMDEWLKNAERVNLSVLGLGPGGSIAYQDRGSWIQVIEWR